MKYGTQNRFYGPDLRESVTLAKEHGCEGFEIGYSVDGIRTGKTTVEELARKAKEDVKILKGLDFEAIAISPGLEIKHAERPDCIEAACKVANILGTRDIRMFFSPHVRLGGPDSTLTEWTAEYDGTKSYWHWFETDSERLRIFEDFARKYDVRWVFELHHGYAATSPSAMRRIMDRYSARYVGTILDPGNMVCEGNEGWRNGVQILGEYIAYLHCKNCRWDQDEDGRWATSWEAIEMGVARYPEIMTALKDIGFDGYLCMEDLRKNVPLEEMVKVPIDYLKALEASQERVIPT